MERCMWMNNGEQCRRKKRSWLIQKVILLHFLHEEKTTTKKTVSYLPNQEWNKETGVLEILYKHSTWACANMSAYWHFLNHTSCEKMNIKKRMWLVILIMAMGTKIILLTSAVTNNVISVFRIGCWIPRSHDMHLQIQSGTPKVLIFHQVWLINYMHSMGSEA
jgi:hypothetical protein